MPYPLETARNHYILIHQNPLQTEQEKRQSPRKKCAIPAVIFSKTDSNLQSKGMVISLSSNSAQVVLKKSMPEEIIRNDIYILFELPKIDHQFLINCNIFRHKCIDSECILILNFEIQNESDERILQNFLVKNEYSEILDA